MFALLCFDIGNERWTTSGFLTRLSNGGPPQVPGTHAGTRGAGEFDGIIAAVKEDEIYYHRDQCDMITMILRLAAEPAWRYERGRQTTPAADRNRRIGGCGTRVIDQACPWERVLYCYFSAPGVLCHFEKAHPSAHGVPYYRANSNKKHVTPGSHWRLPRGSGPHCARTPVLSSEILIQHLPKPNFRWSWPQSLVAASSSENLA